MQASLSNIKKQKQKQKAIQEEIQKQMQQLQIQESKSVNRRRGGRISRKVSIDRVTELDEISESSPLRKRKSPVSPLKVGRIQKFDDLTTPITISPTKVRLLSNRHVDHGQDDNDSENE